MVRDAHLVGLAVPDLDLEDEGGLNAPRLLVEMRGRIGGNRIR